MNTYGYSNSNNNYTLFWNKYRPSILKMMMASETEPQKYQFFSHEFKALSLSTKSFSFSAQVVGGRMTNPTKTPILAKELHGILQQSKKANELMRSFDFEFKLDSKFLFHVTRITPVSNEQAVEKPE